MKTTKLIGMLSLMLMLMTANFVKAQDDEKNVIKDFSGLTLDQLQQHRSQLLALSTSDDYQKKMYIKNAVSALKSELQYNSQMAQNLMATQKLMTENTGK